MLYAYFVSLGLGFLGTGRQLRVSIINFLSDKKLFDINKL